jgi:phosphoglycerol transferase
MVILNLFSLILTALIAASFCKNKWLKAVISLLFSIFFCMQISSLYAGGSFCDYKFFIHFNLRDIWWGAADIYKVEAILLPFVLIGITAGIFFTSKLLFLSNKRPFIFIKSAIFGLSLLFLFVTKNGIVDGLKEGYFLFAVSTTDTFEDAVKNVETAIRKQGGKIMFTKKEDLTASAEGKNIIIISLESFERGFLHDKNKHLTPNINRLKQEWNYFDMYPNHGSNWTAGSLYTALTGLPCLLIGHGNRYFQSFQGSKIINLIDILEKTGYAMYHLSAYAGTGGVGDLLKMLGVQHILDGTLDGKYPGTMEDMDLFNEAKNILQTSSKTKPVMIYISTLSTHCPDGVTDARLFNVVRQGKSKLETAALQTDYLIGDFIKFLKQNGYLENTVVYIFPDHLFMGSPDVLKTKEERKLWFLTNADPKDLHINTTNFYQLDLPRNILSGAKIKHNASFLSNEIRQNKNEFIHENKKLLLILNTLSLERENVLGNFEVRLRDIVVMCLFNNDTLFTKPVDTVIKYEQVIFLTNELKMQSFTEFESGTFDMACWNNYYDLYIKIGVKNKKLDVEWGRDNVLKKTFPPTKKLKMNPTSINETLDEIYSNYTEVKRSEKIPEDTILLDYLQKTLENPSKIIIISCLDDASVHFSKLSTILEQVGLKEVLDCFRCSYIAIFSKNKVYFEKKGQRETALHKKLNIDNVSFYISSGGFENMISKIVINEEDYSCSGRGLNFVIFNTQTKCVEDSFNVDFFGDESLKINRCL